MGTPENDSAGGGNHLSFDRGVMVLPTAKVSPEKIKLMAAKPFLHSMAHKFWRLGLIITLGIGFWLALRWVPTTYPAPQPSLNRFLADGGGGDLEVQGIYASDEYFRLTRKDPAKLGLNPARQLIFFLLIDTHEHDEELADPETWWDGALLWVDGQGRYLPAEKKLVFSSGHHQTVALAFEPKEGNRTASPTQGGVFELVVPGLGGTRTMEWRPHPVESTPSPFTNSFLPFFTAALLPALAGLLVAFSPCLVHMTTYYLPLFGGVAEHNATSMKGGIKVASVAGLFAIGFAVPYTAAGVAMGYTGQFLKGNSLLAVLTQPLTLVVGAIVLFLGLQVAGVFHLPFMIRLNLPALLRGQNRVGYLASGLLGLNLAIGCLGCVGGTLFASMLLYSGVAASPLEGGITLFLFALAANLPFFFATLTVGRLKLRSYIPLWVTRYVPLVSGAVLIGLGLLIVSGTESLIEDALIQALRIQI